MAGVRRFKTSGRCRVTLKTTVARWRNLDTWAPLVDAGSNSPWPLVLLRKLARPVVVPEHIPAPGETVRFAGVRWYGEGLFVREEREGSAVKGRCYPLKPGLLVYNRLFAWKQSFAVVGPSFEGVVVSNEFPQFYIDQDLARTRYVTLVCASAKFAEVALMRSTGSTAVSRNRLHEEDFLGLEIPLPPLDEQDRILAQHDLDMAAAEEVHTSARGSASAAWAAFAEALVEEPKDVQAGGLTSLVRFADLTRWDKPGGETGLVLRYPSSRLDTIADVRLGVQVPRGNVARQSKGGVPYLASRNIRRGHVTLEGVRVMDISHALVSALTLQLGDLLFVEGSGSPMEVGRCAIWNEELKKCIHQNSVVRARLLDHAEVMPEFVESWFNSGPGNEYIREQATTTSGLYHIGASKLSRAPVPLPSLPVQRGLVDALSPIRTASADANVKAKAMRMDARARLEVETFGSPAGVASDHLEATVGDARADDD